VFLAISAVVLGLVVHSGVLRIVHFRASQADGQVTIPRSLVFSASPRRLPPSEAASAELALARYAHLRPFWEGGFGLTWWPGVDLRRAWLAACQHDFAEAERLMRHHLEVFGPADAVATDVMILKSVQLDDAGAMEWGRAYLAEHPGSVAVATQLFRQLQADGRSAEAVPLMEQALADLGPESGDRRHRREASRLGLLRVLSLALVASGDLDRGIEVIERTLEIDDQSWGGWLELTRARALAGRTDGIAQAGERAFALRPTSAVATAVASALESVGRIMEAGAWRARATEAAAAEAAARAANQASASTSN
jgi:tetratricopeptide (TPR) repeat protein